jgi:aspartate/methionine/tyrosine aminotransferase
MSCPFFLKKWLARSGVAGYWPKANRLTDGAGPFLHYYSDRLIAAPYLELREAARGLDSVEHDGIDLASGVTRFDIVPSASTKLPVDLRSWPPPAGLLELREAVSAKLKNDDGLVLDPAEEVLVTRGAVGALTLALEAFLNPGDRVVLLSPTSPLFLLALRHRRARIKLVPTSVEDGVVRFRVDELAKSLKRARLVILDCPKNPTGGVLAAEDLEQIAWWAARRDALILNDQTFERFQYEGDRFSVAVLPKARRRTISIGSMSKGYALTAARVGWLAGYRQLIRPCRVAAAAVDPFVPTLCQQIALAALRCPQDDFLAIRTEFDSRRRYTYERLKSVDLEPIWPSGGVFVWVSLAKLGIDGRSFAARLWQAKKVAVGSGGQFGPEGADFIRLTYTCDSGRLREGLARLCNFVSEVRDGQGSREAA